MNHFNTENHNLHTNYFPDFSYQMLFGVSTENQTDEQVQLPKALEKQQLDFLEHYVEKWLRSKNTRAFFLFKTKVIQTVGRYLSRSM